jgi:hypothetical protein
MRAHALFLPLPFLLLQLLDLLALPLQFQFVLFDLRIQVALFFFQCLHPITNQRPAAQSRCASDRRTRGRMTDRAADNATDSRTAYRADRRALLSCGERLAAPENTECHHGGDEADETSHVSLL